MADVGRQTADVDRQMADAARQMADVGRRGRFTSAEKFQTNSRQKPDAADVNYADVLLRLDGRRNGRRKILPTSAVRLHTSGTSALF